MAQVITLAGERLFALKAQNNQQLDIDTFIFAYVPGQDSTAPIDRNEDLPPVNQRVHQQIVQQYGMLNDNAVVYSSVLDSLTGPFQFNWVGLYSAVNQTLVAIQHIPTVVKTVTEPGASGNILNRNFVIEYSGIAELTGITVDPTTWQYDFNARLNGMDELTRQLAADMNGKDWFIGDGFKVVPRSTLNTFKVTAGAGYVSGLRVELAADHILTLSSYPQFVYVDAWFDGTSESVWKGHTAFTVTNTEMDDYIDVNGRNHYVFKLARITAADAVEDLRNNNGLMEEINAHIDNDKSAHKATAIDWSELNNTAESVSGSVYTLEANGGAGDGVLDNNSALAEIKAKSATATVKLLRNKIYYFSGTRPDLTGCKWIAEQGAKIKADVNPNVKDMDLLTDITFVNTQHQTELIKHKNRNNDYLAMANASLKRRAIAKPKKISFLDIELVSIVNGNFGSFTGAVNETYLSWPTSFTNGQQGGIMNYDDGYLYECAYRHIGTANSDNAAFRGATVFNDDERADFSVYVNQALAKLNIQSTTPSIRDVALPNGGAYSLSTDGSVYVGVRIVGKTAEFYINGTLFETHTFAVKPVKIGFLTSYFESVKCQILHLTKTKILVPVSSKPSKLAVVGDSISTAAWATDSFDEIMKKTLIHAGIGDLSTVNYAVSGSNTDAWIAGGVIDITTKDFSGVDYCFVMLGTNDVQGGTSGLTFEANMRSIVAYLQSINVKPILGVFPVWTVSAVSGITGVVTQNYAKAGWHRQIVRYIAADTNCLVADVCAHFGPNLKWYGDNIHPTEIGQIAVAAACAEAMISDLNGGILDAVESLEVSTILPANPWVAAGGTGNPNVYLNGNSLNLAGALTGGIEGSTLLTLPKGYRPAKNWTFTCWCNDSGNVPGFARVDVQTNGLVVLKKTTVTPYVVFLDQINLILK